jgi:hypothetical protein
MTLVFLVAVLLVGCSGTVPAATPKPTEAPPTAVPSPIPTEIPTATPTDVPTLTATFEPGVWGIAQQMLAECTGARPMPTEGLLGVDSAYQKQLEARVIQDHPELGGIDFFLQTLPLILTNEGGIPHPFGGIDLPEGTALYPWMTICEGYTLALEYLNAENFDRDGILAGEAYLFYEVGGTQPNVLDGKLKEVHFFFPTAAEQEQIVQADPVKALAKAVEAIASQDCLAVFPADLGGEELDSWTNQYLDNLSLEVLAEEHPPQGYEAFFLPPLGSVPECVLMLHQDPASGEAFLIYETQHGFVKVPFVIPSGP